MRSRMSMSLTCAALLALGCVAAAGQAQAGDPPKRLREARADITPFVVAAGKTRVAALIHGDGTIAFSKGIVSVTHIATGEYCIALAPAVSTSNSVPVMSFDYNSSPDYDVFIVYGSSGNSTCPAANTIVVYTYQADAGGHTFADEGFTFVVP